MNVKVDIFVVMSSKVGCSSSFMYKWEKYNRHVAIVSWIVRVLTDIARLFVSTLFLFYEH